METFESPTYFLDYQERSNCSRLQSVKPGGEIAVLVRAEENREEPPIKAVAKRSADGNTIEVTVVVAGRVQIFCMSYNDVTDAVSHYQV